MGSTVFGSRHRFSNHHQHRSSICFVAVDHGKERIEDYRRKLTLSAFSSSSSSNFIFPLDTDIDLDSVPADLKSKGEGWCALFSPRIKRALDVNAVRTLKHDGVIQCVRFSSDGKHLVTCSKHTAQIFDVQTGDKICVLSEKPSAILRSACFSPDGKLLAIASVTDKTIRIWEISQKRVQNTFEGHQEVVLTLCFTPDGRFLVSGSLDKSLRIWDMHDGSSKVFLPDTNSSAVGSLAVSPDGSFVAAGCLDSSVKIWEVNTGRLVEQLKGHTDLVWTVAFTPDGKGLISGGVDTIVNRWDVSALGNHSSIPGPPKSSIQPTFTMKGHRDIVYSVAVSYDGQWIVSGSRDRTVQIWDASNGVVHCMIDGHWDSVGSADLSPVGNYLVTGGGNGKAKIWRLEKRPDQG